MVYQDPQFEGSSAWRLCGSKEQVGVEPEVHGMDIINY